MTTEYWLCDMWNDDNDKVTLGLFKSKEAAERAFYNEVVREADDYAADTGEDLIETLIECRDYIVYVDFYTLEVQEDENE